MQSSSYAAEGQLCWWMCACVGVCVVACCAQVCKCLLNQMFRGWEVTQKVLPKQAPEAAETNRKRDDIEKHETEREKK